MEIQSKKFKIFLIIFLLTPIFLVIWYLTNVVFAWVGPTQNPPYGNVSFKNSCGNVFNEWCSGLGEVCYEVSEDGNGGSVVPECVTFKEDGSIDPPEFIPNVEGDTIAFKRLSGSLGMFNITTGLLSGAEKQAFEVCFGCGPFGNPGSLEGVDFYDGNAIQGMVVFKTPGTYSITPKADDYVEVLVVAGGGGGGTNAGAGGGAGGLKYENEVPITTIGISVVVGSRGGAGANGGIPNAGRFDGGKGGNSQFGAHVTIGGGGGSAGGYEGRSGHSGGSGGGGAAYHTVSGSGGSGTSGQGNSGGSASSNTMHFRNAGGGGAGGAGISIGSGAADAGTIGGHGKQYFGFYYAGGGSGHFATTTANGGTLAGQSATSNTGAGGGSGSFGGSGIVIVRWGGYSKNYNPTTNAVWD